VPLFDGRFTLVTRDREAARWQLARKTLASQGSLPRGLPFQLVSIGDTGTHRDPEGLFAPHFGVGPRGALLVRPDGHVAWRSAGPVEEPAETLAAVLTRILAHAPTTSG